MSAAAVAEAVEAHVAAGPWEPARHPKITGFFCVTRDCAGKTEHHMADDSVAMFWSRGEAAAIAQTLPKN